jgi:hypothetical protein
MLSQVAQPLAIKALAAKSRMDRVLLGIYFFLKTRKNRHLRRRVNTEIITLIGHYPNINTLLSPLVSTQVMRVQPRRCHELKSWRSPIPQVE